MITFFDYSLLDAGLPDIFCCWTLDLIATTLWKMLFLFDYLYPLQAFVL